MHALRAGGVLADKYRVERVLGAGGMGIVVAARHLQLDQLVAVKVLRKRASEDEEATARFMREAKAAVALKSDHVAKVFDVGTLDTGEPFMVLEYLDGCDLAAVARQRSPIGVSEAAEYVLQTCEALAEAHRIGIVHRDIKLANLFVTRGPGGSPLVKVLDFGVSKTESKLELTQTASLLGSPRFMSPEQMRDPHSVDGRTDIWSLGVVMYRLVGGRLPFDAENVVSVVSMVMHEIHDPLSSLRPDLPPGFDAVVERCLCKDLNDRFANVAELAYALAPYCPDRERAQAAADRIAMTLSLVPSPAYTIATARTSTAPAEIDVARRTGRHARDRRGALAAGVVIAALVVGAAVFARAHGVRFRTSAHAPPPPVVTAAPEPPVHVVPVGSVIGASPMPPSSSLTPAPSPSSSPPPVPARAARGRAVAPPRAKPSRPPAKADEGIPSTRD